MHYHQKPYVRNVTGLHRNYEHKRQINAIKDCFIPIYLSIYLSIYLYILSQPRKEDIRTGAQRHRAKKKKEYKAR